MGTRARAHTDRLRWREIIYKNTLHPFGKARASRSLRVDGGRSAVDKYLRFVGHASARATVRVPV